MQLHVLQDKVASAQAKSDKMAAAVSSWGGSMLRRAFTTWKDRHASWQQGHAKAARAAALWQNRALASAWQQWKESAIYQQELRLRLSGAVGKQHSIHFVLAAQTASAHVLHMHCNPCMRATCLAPGHDCLSAHASRQAFGMLQLHHRFVLNVKATSLSELKQTTPHVFAPRPLESRRCGCAARLTHRSLAEAFDAWCFFVADRQRTLQHLQVALAHWGKATLISSWQAWQEHTLYAAQRREIIARALQHFLNRTQAAAFRQWQEVVLKKKEGAGKAAMCLQRLLNSRLLAAFQGWREAACELRDKHLRMQKAALHFLNQRLAICFLTWRAASEEALMGAAKLEHAVGHWLHGTVAKVFNAWRECARFRAYSRPIISGQSAVYTSCIAAIS